MLIFSYNHVARSLIFFFAYITVLKFQIEWLSYDGHMFENGKSLGLLK
jgi:hypothetical protein